MKPQADWWKNIFDERYVQTYADIVTPERTDAEVLFLLKTVIRSKKSHVLDLACGDGRHLLSLASKGYNVTGVDYSAYHLKLLQSRAKKMQLTVQTSRQDMRQLRLNKKADVILSMFTSFGYFQNEHDHQKTASRVSKALRKGGVFFMDLPNAIRLVRNVFGNAVSDNKGRLSAQRPTQRPQHQVETSHALDPRTMHWIMTRSWKERGKTHSYTTSTRLFLLPELENLFASHGLRLKKTWGDFHGGSFTPDSPRMLVLFEKR